MLSLKYCEYNETIREQTTNSCVALLYNDRYVLDIDSSLPLGFVVRFCKVWHVLNRYVSPIKLVGAINAVMKGSAFVIVKERKLPLFVETGLNELGIESALNCAGCLGSRYDKFAVSYNIDTGSLRYWVDDVLKGDIPVVFTD